MVFITFDIQGAQLSCSRDLLIEKSDYFRAMFEGNFIESSQQTITLKGVDVKEMKIILELLYNIDHPIEEEDILAVLQAACMYQFLQIKLKCVERVEELLNIGNCLRFWLCTEQLCLEVAAKAKLLALMEFLSIKDSDDFLDLSLEEVVQYLGNKYLWRDTEFDVFKAIVGWLNNNKDHTETDVFKLLKCLDFTNITEAEISDIISTREISKFPQIVSVLNCLIKTPNQHDDCTKKAEILLKCRHRNTQGILCILVKGINLARSEKNQQIQMIRDQYGRKRGCHVLENDADHSGIVCVDQNLTIKKIFKNESTDLNWDGFKMVGYKHFCFLIGGEMTLGRGEWNLRLPPYNVLNGKLCETPKIKVPFARRHFEVCVCRDNLFVVGGTGQYRVVEENIIWYNFREKEWSDRHELPCSGRQLRCCQLNDNLFILCMNSKRGYVFVCTTGKWTKFQICDDREILPPYTKNLSVFSYKNCIYIKEQNFYKLKFDDDRLVIDKVIMINNEKGCCETESVICGDKLYCLNNRCDEYGCDTNVSLSVFDMDNLENGIIDCKVIRDNDQFKFRSDLIIFTTFLYDMFTDNDLINDFD